MNDDKNNTNPLEDLNIEIPEEQQKEKPLPSIEEQKAIVAKLKELEAKGELTDEALAEHFAQFSEKSDPIH